MSEVIADIYEPVIAQLKAQIEECQRVITMLEMMRAKGAVTSISGSSAATSTASSPAVSFSNDSFFGLTIADAAKKYLNATKKTANARTIAEALIAGGFKSAAKNFVENVRSILSRNQLFVLVNGEFGLAEWYPGRKPSVRGRRMGPEATAEDFVLRGGIGRAVGVIDDDDSNAAKPTDE